MMPDRSFTVAGTTVLRLAAFAEDPAGGNPAGVVLDASGLAGDPQAMMALAAAVGDSETAFVVDGPVRPGRRDYRVRYFAPQSEVPFCGHATIALGVAIGQRIGAGRIELSTPAGAVPVEVWNTAGVWRASFASRPPGHAPLPDDQLDALLGCFGWARHVLHEHIPPALAWAGARHAVLAVRDRSTLQSMSYDYQRLRELSLQHEWVTVHLACPQTPGVHHVRAPFPYGGVVEDPATGAGAAAYAAYLRAIGQVPIPGSLTIQQGVELGRPSVLSASWDAEGPVRVGGPAIILGGPALTPEG